MINNHNKFPGKQKHIRNDYKPFNHLTTEIIMQIECTNNLVEEIHLQREEVMRRLRLICEGVQLSQYPDSALLDLKHVLKKQESRLRDQKALYRDFLRRVSNVESSVPPLLPMYSEMVSYVSPNVDSECFIKLCLKHKEMLKMLEFLKVNFESLVRNVKKPADLFPVFHNHILSTIENRTFDRASLNKMRDILRWMQDDSQGSNQKTIQEMETTQKLLMKVKKRIMIF